MELINSNDPCFVQFGQGSPGMGRLCSRGRRLEQLHWGRKLAHSQGWQAGCWGWGQEALSPPHTSCFLGCPGATLLHSMVAEFLAWAFQENQVAVMPFLWLGLGSDCHYIHWLKQWQRPSQVQGRGTQTLPLDGGGGYGRRAYGIGIFLLLFWEVTKTEFLKYQCLHIY